MSLRNGNLTWHHSKLTRAHRRERNRHRSCVLWLTGLSASGKSTLAFELEKELYVQGVHAYVLDGDNIRHGLNRDLGFTEEDRRENLRRVGETAKLLIDAGLVVIAAFISPSERDRRMVRSLFSDGDYHEVFVRCSLATCESRDPKGLYERARNGQLPGFTGIGADYEAPERPDLVVDTEAHSVGDCVAALLRYLEGCGCLTGR